MSKPSEGTEDYYIVIMKKSRHVPAQGHGYPAYTEQYDEITEYATESELEKFILREPKKDYRVAKCTPLKFETKLVIVRPTVYRETK